MIVITRLEREGGESNYDKRESGGLIRTGGGERKEETMTRGSPRCAGKESEHKRRPLIPKIPSLPTGWMGKPICSNHHQFSKTNENQFFKHLGVILYITFFFDTTSQTFFKNHVVILFHHKKS